MLVGNAHLMRYCRNYMRAEESFIKRCSTFSTYSWTQQGQQVVLILLRPVSPIQRVRPEQMDRPCSAATSILRLLLKGEYRKLQRQLRHRRPPISYLKVQCRLCHRPTRSCTADIRRSTVGRSDRPPPMELGLVGTRITDPVASLNIPLLTQYGDAYISLGRPLLCLERRGDIQQHRLRKLANGKPSLYRRHCQRPHCVGYCHGPVQGTHHGAPRDF